MMQRCIRCTLIFWAFWSTSAINILTTHGMTFDEKPSNEMDQLDQHNGDEESSPAPTTPFEPMIRTEKYLDLKEDKLDNDQNNEELSDLNLDLKFPEGSTERTYTYVPGSNIANNVLMATSVSETNPIKGNNARHPTYNNKFARNKFYDAGNKNNYFDDTFRVETKFGQNPFLSHYNKHNTVNLQHRLPVDNEGTSGITLYKPYGSNFKFENDKNIEKRIPSYQNLIYPKTTSTSISNILKDLLKGMIISQLYQDYQRKFTTQQSDTDTLLYNDDPSSFSNYEQEDEILTDKNNVYKTSKRDPVSEFENENIDEVYPETSVSKSIFKSKPQSSYFKQRRLSPKLNPYLYWVQESLSELDD